jgi:hypothetical protein
MGAARLTIPPAWVKRQSPKGVPNVVHLEDLTNRLAA